MDKIKKMLPGAHKTHHSHTTGGGIMGGVSHKIKTGVMEKIVEKIIPGAHHSNHHHSHTTGGGIMGGGGTHKTGIVEKIAAKVIPGASHNNHHSHTHTARGGIVEQIKEKLPGGHGQHKHY